jgi:HAD superfamily hydrolase (TIGR01509 family)
MDYDLVIFDCDGTLVDSEYLNNLATCELLAQQGLAQYDLDYAFENFVGIKFSNILAMISRETGHVFPEDFSQSYVERVRALAPQHLKKIDGAEALVREAGKRTKICVASNGQRANVLHSLEWAGLLHYFGENRIFAGLDAKNPKPAPDIFLLAAEKMDADPARALVLEDSVAGVTGGLAAGMEVWGFTGAHTRPEDYEKKLKAAGAVRCMATFIHIREALNL